MDIASIEVGDTASMSKVFSEDSVSSYADLSRDNNPLHLNPTVAKKSIFGKQVVQGMLVSGLISGVLGTRLPGDGSIYLEQHIKFKAPVFFGDEITAKVTVTEIDRDRDRCTLSTICTNQDGKVVVDGYSVMLVSDERIPQ